MQREGLWLLSGLESGGINLQSVRVDEGKRIARLQGHTSAVSVLSLAQDESSVLSGSWDKTVVDWDLNTGSTIRKFEGSGGQISALETRPLSSLPVPEASGEIELPDKTFTTKKENTPLLNEALTNGADNEPTLEPLFGEQAVNGDAASPNDSLFGGNEGDSLFGDTENDAGAPSGGNFVTDGDDEFSQAIADGMREQAEVLGNEQEKTKADAEGDAPMGGVGDETVTALISEASKADADLKADSPVAQSTGQQEIVSSAPPTTDLPHEKEVHFKNEIHGEVETHNLPKTGDPDPTPTSDSTFLAASFDGSLGIWDKRQPKPIAKISPQNVPPWCMNATWSPDGNFIYAGRRNGTVDEYSLHKGFRGAERSFKLPNNSGPVSALRAMPNGRHLIW